MLRTAVTCIGAGTSAGQTPSSGSCRTVLSDDPCHMAGSERISVCPVEDPDSAGTSHCFDLLSADESIPIGGKQAKKTAASGSDSGGSGQSDGKLQ